MAARSQTFELRIENDTFGVYIVVPPSINDLIVDYPDEPERGAQRIPLDSLGVTYGTICDANFFEAGRPDTSHRVIRIYGTDPDPRFNTLPGMAGNMTKGTVSSHPSRPNIVIVSGSTVSFCTRGLRFSW